MLCFFFFEGYGDHRDLHVLTHSFPTRLSSDLRGRGRPARDAEIWHGRPPRLLRRRPQVAGALRVRRAECAHAERGSFGMKITLDWLKEHLDGDFSVADVVATLNRIGHEVEGVENPAEKLAGFRVAKVLTAEKHPKRSEEHTAELQAIMRSTYAVLCL